MHLELNLKNNLNSFIFILIAALFYVSPIYLSFMSLLLMPISLSLIIFTGFKNKINNILLPLFIVNIVLFMIFKIEGITFFINCTLPAVLLLTVLNSNKYKITFKITKKIVLWVIGYSILLTIIAVILLRFSYFYKLSEQLINYINNYFDNYLLLLKKQNLTIKQLEYFKDIKLMVIKIIISYYPAVIFVNYLFFLALNLFLSMALISNYILKKPKFAYLLFLRLKDSLIWVFISSWALVFVSLYLKSDLYSQIIWNIALIISSVYIIQGIIILFNKLLFLKIRPIFKFIFLFILIELIFGFFIYAVFIILGLGIFDTWLDFRHITKIKNIETLI